MISVIFNTLKSKISFNIENAIHVENNVQSAYDDFCILIQDEMDNKLPRTKHKTYNNNCGKSRMVWYSFRIKIDLINDICHF
jgi:hypothetical protein